MNPIYDRNGETVGWINADSIIDLLGERRARIVDGNVYSYDGGHLGQFSNGYFWDESGEAVAFVQGAQGGPMLPVTSVSPVAPVTSVAPVPGVTEVAPVAPVHSFSWSDQSFESFLG